MATKQVFLSVTQAAQLSGLSRAWIKRLCQHGKIPGVTQVGQQYCIPAGAVPVRKREARAGLVKNPALP